MKRDYISPAHDEDVWAGNFKKPRRVLFKSDNIDCWKGAGYYRIAYSDGGQDYTCDGPVWFESYAQAEKALLSECESLLEQSEKFEAECMGHVNENGRISLHLYDRASETYVYDLDCNVGEMPERVWCEYLYTPFGNGYEISSQQDHMHNVRANRENGLSLDAVWPSYSFCWVNDHDRIVDGPKVWAARYTDKALALC